MAASAQASFPCRSLTMGDFVCTLTLPYLGRSNVSGHAFRRRPGDVEFAGFLKRLAIGLSGLTVHDDGEVGAKLFAPEALGTRLQRSDLDFVHGRHPENVF